MRLALVGKNISHSLSPKIYRKLLGRSLTYDLIDLQSESHLPTLHELASLYDGLNITSPFKKHYRSQLHEISPEAAHLGAVNTISLKGGFFKGTNSDYLAVESLIHEFLKNFPASHMIILGDGVMGHLTQLICQRCHIPFRHFSRKKDGDIGFLDLRQFHQEEKQLLVINACSRDFIFQGETSGQEIFWDYNYSFLPHQNTLPFHVKEYWDGQELLNLQALMAVEFWQKSWP